MKIDWLQHVPFEGLAVIESWSRDRGYQCTSTRLWADDPLPDPAAVEMLIIMGGPMGVHDEERYPWLVDEKRFIRAAADGGAAILGICLGAQLVAAVFGARVSPNPDKEIGWFPVTAVRPLPDWAEPIFPAEMTMFHWHGDTFTIPVEAVPLFTSAGCRNQGFAIGERIVGLQFHPEMTDTWLPRLLANCRAEIVPGPFIQTEEEMTANLHLIPAANAVMIKLLDHLAARAPRRQAS